MVVLFARAAFELAALNYYLRKHVKDAVAKGDFKDAHRRADQATSGNRHLNEFDVELLPEHEHLRTQAQVADTISLKAALACYSQEVLKEKKDELREDYSFLSELAHPNSAAVNHYLAFDFQNRRMGFRRQIPEDENWNWEFGRAAAFAAVEIQGLFELADEIDR